MEYDRMGKIRGALTDKKSGNNLLLLKIVICFLFAFFCSTLSVEAIAVGTKWDYTATGEYQTFTAPESTWYKIELWGARGGQGRRDGSLSPKGGAGAYTGGEIYLEKGTTLYIYVGKVGGTPSSGSICSGGGGGWNGGGKGGNDSNCSGSKNEPGGGGGGATDIRLVPTSAPTVWNEFDSLKSRIMVAAGGGGSEWASTGAAGGTLTGIARALTSNVANQTSGRAFGQGAPGVAATAGSGAGGGGYWGGRSSGGGGSSFVSGCRGCIAIDENSTSSSIVMLNSNIHYSGYKFDKIQMYAGATDSQPNGSGGYQIGNYATGKARISVAEPRSSNNYLKNIVTSNGTLSPNFSKTTEKYDLILDSDISEVELNGVVEDSKSVVGGNGKYQVKYGEEVTASISITNEIGEVRVYKVNISRRELASGEHSSKLADLDFKVLNEGAIVPNFEDGFHPNSLEYNISVSSSVAALDFDAIPLDSEATIVKEGVNKILGDSGTLKITVSAPECSDTVYLIHYTKSYTSTALFEYSATGQYQTFIAPVHGKYRVQLWGSQGFGIAKIPGGKGAYTKGDIILEKDEKLYIYVGDNEDGNSFNGGGSANKATNRGYTGGGATDVRLVSGPWNDFDSLKSRIMVAAGGGGGFKWANWTNSYGGAAGGLFSYDLPYSVHTSGNASAYFLFNTTATQTSAGLGLKGQREGWNGFDGRFGIGGNGSSTRGGGAGGGGYFGGSGGGSATYTMTSGSGGSSYISGHIGCNSIIENSSWEFALPSNSEIHYSNKYFTDTEMIDGLGYSWVDASGPNYTSNTKNGKNVTFADGEYTGQPTPDGSSVQEGQEGNGFAKIELLNDSNNNYLADLKTNYGKFSEEFDPLKNKITLNLDKYEQHFTLTGELADKTATVTGLGQYRVGLGQTKVINIAVTSVNGETRIYEVTAIRGNLAPGEHSTKLEVLDINGGSYQLNPEFISIETNYELSAPYSAIALDVDAIPYDKTATVKIEGNGYINRDKNTIRITVTHPEVETTIYEIKVSKEENIEGKKVVYECTESEQEFIVPATTYYRVQLWGAAGGQGKRDNVFKYRAGNGAYTEGEIYLKKGQKIYVYVGCIGKNASSVSKYVGGLGGFNGGGKGGNDTDKDSAPEPAGGGGGATDIRLVPSSNKVDYFEFPSLKSRIMVAAGGGGSNYGGMGGSGGTLTGLQGYGAKTLASQTGGYSFGTGAAGANNKSGRGGGGGGYYGGNSNGAGGGGSSFVSGCDGCVAIEQSSIENGIISSADNVHYSGMAFDKITMISGDETQPSTTGSYQTGNTDDGHAIITAAKPRSENNFLSEITVDKGTLTPEYDVIIKDYNVKLGSEDDRITIDAKLDDEKSTMTGTGTFDVPMGKTTFPITVTAENGSIRIYTVTVEREKSSNPYPLDISIKGLVPALCNVNLSYCHLTPEFNPDTNSYSITVPSRLETVDFVVTKAHKYQTVIGDGQVKLEKGVNTFTIEVISEDEEKVSTYTFSIDRDMTGDANISKLEVLDPPTDIGFEPETVEYSFSIPNRYTSVELNIELQDPNSTYKVIGNENFVTGNNIVKIEVTAENGYKKTYVLNIYREQSGNTFIDEIRVEHGSTIYPLVPIYNKMIHDYTVTVPNEIDEVNIIATPEHSLTKISGSGTKKLATGVNKFELTSTSEDGTTQIYTVSVIREKSNDATLKSLDVLEGTLSPEFQSKTLVYDIEVSSDVDHLNLNPVLSNANAKYRVTGNNNFKLGKNVVYITVTAEDGTKLTYILNVIVKPNDNNYLSSLKVTGQTLDPIFNKEIQNYDITVGKNVMQVVVSATPEVSSAKVSGIGTYNLSSGYNTIDIEVEAEDGSTRIYTINILREMSSDSTLVSLTTSSLNSYTPKFAAATTEYTLEVENEEDIITVIGVSNDPNAKVTGNGTYTLDVGDNVIEIQVEAEDGTETTYILIVRRKGSDNANISLLLAKESVLDPDFEKDTLNYELRVLESVTNLTLYINLEDSNATYEVIGNENFEIGHNTVTIKVTAEDGVTTKEYVLDVLRQEAGTASNRLLNLEVSQGTLNPNFDPDTNYYEAEVSNETTNIALDGELEDKNATVTGFGNYPLEVGKNTLYVKVTSTENIIRYYQVIVTRKGKSEARLNSLVVNNHSLTPLFDKDTYEYKITTEDSFLVIEAKPIDSNATYEILGDDNLEFGSNEVMIRVTAEDGVTTKDYIIHVEREKSKNNNLKLLEVSGVTLTPTFESSKTVYLGEVASTVNNVVITALPEDPKATVEGDDSISLAMGANYIDITVTSEAGTKKVYTVVITRVGSSDNDLIALYTSEGTLSPTFNKIIHDYTVTVPYEVEDIVISGTLSDVNASVVGFDKYKLEVGENPIKIIVTAEDGTVNFYNIVVTRENIVSSLLESLSVKDYKIDQTFASEVFDYTVTVDYEVTELDLNIQTLDRNATYVINGNSNFNVGMNTVEIVVTDSLGKTTSTYTLYVNRQNYSNTYLSYIYTNKGELDPVFEKETLSYTVEVDSDVDTINVMAAAEVTTNTVEGTGTYSLEPGDNLVAITVKTPTGIKRVYYVNIIRKQDDSNDLTSLRVKANGEEQTLDPVFNKDHLDYSVTVSPSTPNVEILATTTNKASISGVGIRPLTVGDNIFNVTVTSESGVAKVYTITVHREPSDNNYLASLVPSAGTLDPVFNGKQQEYTLVVDSNTTTLSFEAKPKDQFATVSGVEKQIVAQEESIREIVVTAENGDTRVYRVKVIKERGDEARLSELKIPNYPLEETFDKDNYHYTVTLPQGKTELTKDDVIAIPIDSKAVVTKMEKLVLSTEQDNIYEVEVTARDGFTKQTYTIKINLVTDIDITDIILENELILGVGEKIELKPTFEPVDATNKEIEYVSNDTGIVTVENGEVTGIKEGETTIIVSSKKDPTVKKKVKIKVINLKITSQVYDVRRGEVNLFDPNEIKDIIIGADEAESLTDFVGKLDNDADLIKIYDLQKQLITDLDNNVVVTGYRINLEYNNKVYDSVYLVVRGDNTQDGVIDVDDNALTVRQILSKVTYDPDTLVFKASDVEETQLLDVDDTSKLNRYILGRDKSLN